jgi:large subunit ribosomal protein L25
MAANLIITKRDSSGKKESRKLRHQGLIPGVIYGGDKEPTLVSVSEKELMLECYTLAFLGHVIEAKIDTKIEKFLPTAIDFHPVTDRPIHIDFQRISKGSNVKIGVPIEFINEDKSPGLKKGGIINFVVHKLECLCPYESIPEKIVLDLARKEIGESFHLSDIKLPEGVTATHTGQDLVIATIVNARVSTVDTEATTEEETPTEEETES